MPSTWAYSPSTASTVLSAIVGAVAALTGMRLWYRDPVLKHLRTLPGFHSDASSLPVLAAQRIDAYALAQDAEERGWITEARPPPQAHRPPRHPHQPDPSRMTSTDPITRVEQACTELLADHQPITFTQVAARSGLGRTTLYRNPTLRALIEEHRQRFTPAGTLTGLAADIAALRTTLEALATRVRHHEEQLRKIGKQRTP